MKTAIVTGGAGGIGQAIAAQLIGQGYDVFLADLNEAGLDQAVETMGSRCRKIRVDITDNAQVEKMVGRVAETCGRIDLLVNNAGIIVTQPFDQCALGTLLLENQLNYVAALACIKAVLPHMTAAGQGTVVSVSSLGSIVPLASSPGYTASKAALRGLMLSLNLLFSSRNIHMGCVCPGAVDTPMLLFEAKNNGSLLNFLQPPLNPEAVAAAVWKVISQKKAEVCVPFHEGIFSKLGGFFPHLLPRMLPWLLKMGEKNRTTYLKRKATQLQKEPNHDK